MKIREYLYFAVMLFGIDPSAVNQIALALEANTTSPHKSSRPSPCSGRQENLGDEEFDALVGLLDELFRGDLQLVTRSDFMDRIATEMVALGVDQLEYSDVQLALFQMAKSSSEQVRLAAITCWSRIYVHEMSQFSILLEALNDASRSVRIVAIQAISGHKLERFADDVLRLCAASPSKQERIALLNCIAALQIESGIDDLLGSLGSQDANIRHVAITGLGRFDGLGVSEIEAICNLIVDESVVHIPVSLHASTTETISHAAFRSLAKINPDDASACIERIDHFIESEIDSNGPVGSTTLVMAIVTRHGLAPHDARFINDHWHIISDGTFFDTRRTLLDASVGLPNVSDQILQIIIDAANGNQEELAELAAVSIAFGEWKRMESESLLIDLLNSPIEGVRCAALDGLAHKVDDARRTRNAANRFLRSPDYEVRYSAIRLAIKSEVELDTLVELFETEKSMTIRRLLMDGIEMHENIDDSNCERLRSQLDKCDWLMACRIRRVITR